jgi:hypothetical protein
MSDNDEDFLAGMLRRAQGHTDHAAIHPAASEFIARFDGRPITEALPESVLRLSGCIVEQLLPRLAEELSGHELAQIHIFLAMFAFDLGWLARGAHDRGELRLGGLGGD